MAGFRVNDMKVSRGLGLECVVVVVVVVTIVSILMRFDEAFNAMSEHHTVR